MTPARAGEGGGAPPRRRRALAGLALAGIALSLVFAGLGVWQVERLAWKRDLIARVEARLAAAPVPPPPPGAWAALDPADAEYRRLRLEGRFLHDREALTQAVTELGPGFWVLTPFALDDGTTVLVNRGFVPPERRDPATRADAQVEGETALTGLLRLTEPGGGFLRTNDPAADRWFSRDVAAIGQARGLGSLAPFFVDADAAPNPGGYPVGGLTVVSFRNSHLVYALTWFTLSLMVAGATLYVLRDERRRRRQAGARPAR